MHAGYNPKCKKTNQNLKELTGVSYDFIYLLDFLKEEV
jgi:hypothetical protein